MGHQGRAPGARGLPMALTDQAPARIPVVPEEPVKVAQVPSAATRVESLACHRGLLAVLSVCNAKLI